MSGDCFEVAARLVALGDPRSSLELGDRDEARVVHGLPVGRGPQNEGRRYFDETGGLTTVTVIDRANGLDLALPRELYYAMGALSEERVWRFTVLTARRELRDRGHYGPWVDDWERLEEVG